MSILIRHGWEIYFHRQLFGEQRRQLREEVKKLKDTLSADEFVTHPKVKLLVAVMAGIKEKIVLDPFASHFALQGPLKHYSSFASHLSRRIPRALSKCCYATLTR